jgi:hypothetical protein
MQGPDSLERMRQLLCDLQHRLREAVCAARDADHDGALAGVAEITAADTIYKVDKVSEALIHDWFAANWPRDLPVEVVMEGAEETGSLTFPDGIDPGRTEWKCILDPIDGTRNLMYDKRPAWAIGGIAPQRGARTLLSDIVVAAQTELPTSRHWRADQISAVRGRGIRASAHDLRSGGATAFHPQPSRAADCAHGFATVTRFFPDGLALLGEFEERLWATLYPDAPGGSPLVFNDQYITTAGQLYELIAGRDRFTADLRPLAFHRLGLGGSLSAHPYDLASTLVATEAGVRVEDPASGGPLQAPLDTTTPVAWVAYANPRIADRIRPVLQRLIREMFPD